MPATFNNNGTPGVWVTHDGGDHWASVPCQSCHPRRTVITPAADRSAELHPASDEDRRPGRRRSALWWFCHSEPDPL